MTRFKVCGLTRTADAVAAVDAGADFIGLIFAPSKRQLLPNQARDLLKELRTQRPSGSQNLQIVGVFVNSAPEEINQLSNYCGLDKIQLHGDENLKDYTSVELPIFKVIRINPDSAPKNLLFHLEEKLKVITDAQHTPMLDTASKDDYYGGTGQTFDWSIAAELAKKYDFVLSGGLRPNNIADAICQVRPWAVDVSSGVETSGHKDHKKILGFAQAVAKADITNYPSDVLTSEDL